MAKRQKSFVVHTGESIFYLSDVQIYSDSVYGNIKGDYKYPYDMSKVKVNSPRRYLPTRGEKDILNEAHLFVNEIKKTTVPGYYKAAFALKDLWRLDINEKNKDVTAASMVIGVVGTVIGSFFGIIILIFLIGMLTGSCPLIYVNNGNGYSLAGEIYSGAVYAPLERHDYLVLSDLVPEKGSYRLKMANEAREIQNTNLAELFVVDHPVNSEVLYDKYGKSQTSINSVKPAMASNLEGLDVLPAIGSKDEICYIGDIPNNNIPLTDGVIMTFDLPGGVSSGKLFIRARNSVWLDYVYKNSHELFGGYYDQWVRKQNKRDGDDMKQWYLDQKIPLMVYIEKNGEWEFCDYFNNAGPASFRDDVLALDFKGADDVLKIKLESGAFFWEIDYAAIDYSPNLPVEVNRVLVGKAITNKDTDVAGMLKYDDLKYYSQENIGDDADLEFMAPQLTEKQRTVFLHSKGYYQILSESSGLPKPAKLKELREPMKFPEFSRKMMMEKISEFSRPKK